ncbi:hypothetical protein MJI46_33135, partial [Salmonella enterica subsp. enterica serovar Cerro]|nr:hypothetical protein [Salmonella enterica subsp. enterica serovar Cerro]
ENLEELVTATRQFSYNDEDEDLMPLQAFLSHAALEAGEGQADDIRFGASISGSHVAIDDIEGAWNSSTKYEGGNKGHRPGVKGG